MEGLTECLSAEELRYRVCVGVCVVVLSSNWEPFRSLRSTFFYVRTADSPDRGRFPWPQKRGNPTVMQENKIPTQARCVAGYCALPLIFLHGENKFLRPDNDMMCIPESGVLLATQEKRNQVVQSFSIRNLGVHAQQGFPVRPRIFRVGGRYRGRERGRKRRGERG